MRAALALAAVAVIASACADNCSCGAPPQGGSVDVRLGAEYGSAALIACFGACVETPIDDETWLQLPAEAFAAGWEQGRITFEVVDGEGRVLTAFRATPELVDGCCGEYWRVDEPTR